MSAGISGGDQHLGIDRYDRLQHPTLNPTDDLTRFVTARIIDAESETRETYTVHDEPNGAMAYRYAGAVRRDMVAYRRIVANYLAIDAAAVAQTEGTPESAAADSVAMGLASAVVIIANRWADHPGFRDEWRIQ